MLIKESTFDLTIDSVIGSKTNHCDGACDFLTKEASVDSVKYFNDLVAKPDHVYLLVVAMTSGEHFGPNRNGDYFKEEDLIKYHKVFEDAGVFWNHDNKDKLKSSGVVIKSFWNDVMHRIELVIEMPQEKARYIPEHIEKGIPIRVSMGLSTPSETCSICGHVTRGSYANRCEHLKYMMNTILHDGKQVYAVSGTPYKIFDISIISGRQADKTAFSMLTKTASTKGGLSEL